MGMIQCENCMAIMPEGSRFCGHCGGAANAVLGTTLQGSKTPSVPLPVLEDSTPSISERNTSTHGSQMQGKQVWSEADLSIIDSDEEYNYSFSSPSIETILEIEKHPTIPLHSETESEKKFLPILAERDTSPRHKTQSVRRTSQLRPSKPRAKPLKLGRSGAILAVAIAATVIVAAALGIHALTPSQHTHPSPTLSLGGGPIAPSRIMPVHGSNFTARGSVTLTVDGHPATIASRASNPQTVQRGYASASLLLLSYTTTSSSATVIPVKSDGTFDAAIRIDSTWPIGSSHLLIVTDQSSAQQASLRFVIPPPAVLTACPKATASTTLALGPVDEGSTKSASGTFQLCTAGSGEVNWTASWNQKQVKWLQVASSGQIQAPHSKQLTVTASAAGLNAGMYSATVTFSSPGSPKVILKVTLTVRSPKSTAACVTTSTQSLSFTATQGQADPVSQKVTLTNCGNDNSWTVSTHTDDGANWLIVNNASGTLNARATDTVSISVDSTKLPQTGVYQGTATFTITTSAGSSTATVNVTFNFSPPQSCSLSASPSTLDFGSVQQNQSASKTLTLSNSGGQPVTWTADTGGASWLRLDATTGTIDPGKQQTITVTADTSQSGQYQTTLTFSSSCGNPQVAVTLVVTPPTSPCNLSASPSTLDFGSVQQNQSASKTLTLSNSGGQPVTWTADTGGASWLTLDATTGTIDPGKQQTITVTADTSQPNTYNATLTFSSSCGNPQVAVSLVVTAPTSPCSLSASPSTLDFGSVQQGQGANKQLTLTNSGGQAVTWTADTGGASWLTLSPTSDTIQPGGQETVTVTADTSQLQPNTYNATLTFSSSCGSPQVTVTVVVTAPPHLLVSPTSLSFTEGCSTSSSQSVTVSNGGGGTLTWTVGTPSASWLTAAQDTTATPGTLTLTANSTGMSNATYTATVDITGSDGSTQTVTVTLTVQCVS